MKTHEVKEWFDNNEINPESIAFYSRLIEWAADRCTIIDEPDTCFTFCDVSGLRGDCVHCTALFLDGRVCNLLILDSLVGGAVGRLAGAF